MTMTANGEALRRRHLIFTLGGVANNLFVAIFCLVAGQLLFAAADEAVPIAFLRPNALIIASLNLFAIANICNVLRSLVLSKPGVPPSDGTQLSL